MRVRPLTQRISPKMASNKDDLPAPTCESSKLSLKLLLNQTLDVSIRIIEPVSRLKVIDFQIRSKVYLMKSRHYEIIFAGNKFQLTFLSQIFSYQMKEMQLGLCDKSPFPG